LFVLHTQKNTSFVLHYSKKHVICTGYSKKYSKRLVLRTQKGNQKVGKKRRQKMWQKGSKKRRQKSWQKNTPKKDIATYTTHILIVFYTNLTLALSRLSLGGKLWLS
jgi:hypothetical protein